MFRTDSSVVRTGFEMDFDYLNEQNDACVKPHALGLSDETEVSDVVFSM